MNKRALRILFQEKRNELTLQQKKSFDQIVTDKTIELIRSQNIHMTHIYLTREQSAEIDTWPLVKWIWSQKLSVCCPYIVPGTSEMKHYMLQEGDKIFKNKWGIPEPDPSTAIELHPSDIPAVIIPLLAFDKNGYRVGYGGGFYDRFLPQCKPDILKIGLSYFPPVNDIEDKNLHDIPLDICITPSQIFSWI